MTTRSNPKVYFSMCSYRAHSSVKNLLKFTRKLLWNLLENYLEIYSKLTVRRLCYGTFTKGQFLQYVSTVHAVPHMSINGHVCVIFRMNECIVEVMFASYGHTTLDIPDPIRTPKSSRVGLT